MLATARPSCLVLLPTPSGKRSCNGLMSVCPIFFSNVNDSPRSGIGATSVSVAGALRGIRRLVTHTGVHRRYTLYELHCLPVQ